MAVSGYAIRPGAHVPLRLGRLRQLESAAVMERRLPPPPAHVRAYGTGVEALVLARLDGPQALTRWARVGRSVASGPSSKQTSAVPHAMLTAWGRASRHAWPRTCTPSSGLWRSTLGPSLPARRWGCLTRRRRGRSMEPMQETQRLPHQQRPWRRPPWPRLWPHARSRAPTNARQQGPHSSTYRILYFQARIIL